MWHNNRDVTATYAHHSSQWAWAEISGLGWRRIKNGSTDGCTNIFLMMNSARAAGRKVSVDVNNQNLITTAYLL